MIQTKTVELFPMFQRIVKLSEPEKDFAYEALIRGKDESGRRISPAVLFESAHQQQCLEVLDFRARKIALQKASTNFEDTFLFLNCHRSSLDIGRVFEEKIEVPYNKIVLEITEQKRMKNVKESARFLRKYREMGMKIAIDDFGSGYSNFDLIGELAPEFVKLDQSLIANVDYSSFTSHVIEGLVAFSELTEIKLIAEGIERESQLHVLQNLGIEYGQGFFLGYPFEIENR